MHPEGLSPDPYAVSPAYTIDEVVVNFTTLLEQMDWQRELRLLGIGSIRFRLRRRMKKEWTALFVGLWRLALVRSFPHDGDSIFQVFLEQYKEKLDNTKEAEAFTLLAEDYATSFIEQGASDFTAVSEHLIGLVYPRTPAPALRLRVALHVRNLYTLVFDRLI